VAGASPKASAPPTARGDDRLCIGLIPAVLVTAGACGDAGGVAFSSQSFHKQAFS